MSDKKVSQALEFLKSGNIIERVVQDMDVLGYVGERENKLLGYLISISRKLDEPLSGIVVSSSGAGKSRLVDTIELLTPPEDIVFASRLTAQSLYYMKKDLLRHKLLIIEERIGSELADYAIRTLQSKGKLALAAPIRNQTVFFEVEGPVSVLETTASFRLNPENITRCFIMHLDESRKQTERVHNYQRLLKTEKGIELKNKVGRIIEFYHNLQRLLKKEHVVIPYAEKLSFSIDTSSLRRDNQRFLTLIEAVTLLYQYQRKRTIKKDLTFIESTPEDYEIAFNIFNKSYSNKLIFVHPKAALLLNKITQMNKNIFSRKEIAEFSSWPTYQIRDNIGYLEETGLLEILKKQKGKETLYRLNKDTNLISPKELEEKYSSTT